MAICDLVYAYVLHLFTYISQQKKLKYESLYFILWLPVRVCSCPCPLCIIRETVCVIIL